MSNLWNPNPDFTKGSPFYNASLTYNDAILYNGTSDISNVYYPTGALWAESSFDDILDESGAFVLDEQGLNIFSEIQDIVSSKNAKPTLWLGNPDFNTGVSLYNAAITYNDGILYDGVADTDLLTIYAPNSTLWGENAAAKPIIWLGNANFNVGVLFYNSPVTYNDAITYNDTSQADLTTNYVPTGTIWTGVN